MLIAVCGDGLTPTEALVGPEVTPQQVIIFFFFTAHPFRSPPAAKLLPDS